MFLFIPFIILSLGLFGTSSITLRSWLTFFGLSVSTWFSDYLISLIQTVLFIIQYFNLNILILDFLSFYIILLEIRLRFRPLAWHFKRFLILVLGYVCHKDLRVLLSFRS